MLGGSIKINVVLSDLLERPICSDWLTIPNSLPFNKFLLLIFPKASVWTERRCLLVEWQLICCDAEIVTAWSINIELFRLNIANS